MSDEKKDGNGGDKMPEGFGDAKVNCPNPELYNVPRVLQDIHADSRVDPFKYPVTPIETHPPDLYEGHGVLPSKQGSSSSSDSLTELKESDSSSSFAGGETESSTDVSTSKESHAFSEKAGPSHICEDSGESNTDVSTTESSMSGLSISEEDIQKRKKYVASTSSSGSDVAEQKKFKKT